MAKAFSFFAFGILSSALSVTPAFGADWMCEAIFQSPPAWTQKSENAKTQVQELQDELARPNSERKTKDPRWFARFRNPEKNPVTIELKTKLADAQSRQDALARQLLLYRRIETLESLVNSAHFTNIELANRFELWARKHVLEIRGMLNVEFTKADQFTAVRTRMDEFEKSIKALKIDRNNTDASLQELRTIIRLELNEITFEYRSLVESTMGRALRADVFQALLAVQRQSGRSMEDVLKLMRETDDLGGQRLGRDQKTKEGIEDQLVAVLVKLAVEHGRTPTQIVDLFKEIDQLGFERDGKKILFTVPDFEVTALVQIALQQKVTAPVLMKRFFEIRDLGKTHPDSKTFSHLSDSAIVSLTYLSLLPKASSPQQLVQNMFALFDYYKKVATTLAPTDLALATLLHSVHQKGLSVENAIESYRTYRSQVMSESTRSPQLGRLYFDEEVARWAQTGILFDVTPKALVETARRIAILTDESVAAPSLHTMLNDAYTVARVTGQKDATDDQLKTIVQKRLVQHVDPLAWIRDESFRAAQRRQAAAARDASLNPTTTSHPDFRSRSRSRSSPLSSSSTSSSTSSDSGLGFTIGPDGFKPHLGLGSGVGIDLSDGSLTFGSGPVRFDTDGDGFSIKL